VAANAQRAPSSDPTLAGCTVLIIEDHRDSREMLSQVLTSLRAHVLPARNIDEAERQLDWSHSVRLIICDMKLPDGTGLDFIKWLRAQKRTQSIPSIAVTGYDRHFPPTAATGFDAYMRKPINIDRFCDVAVALARR
jgi:CheY-like chemotaxis protein